MLFGNKVSDKAECCPECGCPVELKINCFECGAPISHEDKICPKMWSSFKEIGQSKPNYERDENNTKVKSVFEPQKTLILIGIIF